MVERYLPVVAPYRPLDLARPVTALEHKEYRIQLTVRSLVVQLILEVRQTPHLASLTLALPQDAPPRLGTFHGALPPDAVLSIVWYPARVQPADWLPWLQPTSAVEQAIHYPLYLDRAMPIDRLPRMIDAWSAPTTSQQVMPILLLQNEERLTLAQHVLQVRSHSRPVRVSTWQRLTAGISEHTWLDERGRTCSLQPRMEGAP